MRIKPNQILGSDPSWFLSWLCGFLNNSLDFTGSPISPIFEPEVTLMVNLLQKLPDCFSKQLALFHSHMHYKRFPFSPHPCQLLLLSFFIITIPLGVKWYLIVASVFIYLMAYEVRLSLLIAMCYLVKRISPLEKCLLRSSLVSLVNCVIYLFYHWVVRVLYLLSAIGFEPNMPFLILGEKGPDSS